MTTTLSALSAYLHSCRARGLSLRTIQFYESILRRFAIMFPNLPYEPDECEAFITNCTAGDERRHGYFRTLRAFYNYLEKRISLKSAMTLVEAPKRKKKLPRPVMPDRLLQLLTFPHTARIKAALYFLTDTGVRIGELANLRLEDFIETSFGYLATVDGKTGPRIVPVSKEAHDLIINILPFNITANHLSRILSQAFRDAHVPGTAHCLRHSFGTLWRGEDITLLQRIMGHADIKTTMAYRMVQYEQMEEAHSRYSPLKMVLSRQNGDII